MFSDGVIIGIISTWTFTQIIKFILHKTKEDKNKFPTQIIASLVGIVIVFILYWFNFLRADLKNVMWDYLKVVSVAIGVHGLGESFWKQIKKLLLGNNL